MFLFYLDFDKDLVPNLAEEISKGLKEKRRGCLGNLGGGNHFIDFFQLQEGQLPVGLENKLFGVVHCGNSGFGEKCIRPEMGESEFLGAYKRAYEFSKANRRAIIEMVSDLSGKNVGYLVEDKTHNDLELIIYLDNIVLNLRKF